MYLRKITGMTSQLFKLIEHTADTGFEVTGNSLPDVFRAAATALFQLMWDIDAEKEAEPVDLQISGIDSQELLVNFLEEFLYLYDAKGLICTRVEVTSVEKQKLTATAWLHPFDHARDQEIMGVKAITYHQIYIGKKDSAWLGRVFLDI